MCIHNKAKKYKYTAKHESHEIKHMTHSDADPCMQNRVKYLTWKTQKLYKNKKKKK